MRYLRRRISKRFNGCGFFVLNTFAADDVAASCNVENVIAEYHILAYYYGWPFAAIRGLPRSFRQLFCYKIQKQIEAENGKNVKPLDGGATELISGGKPYRESNY